jgi:hypothetical protein
MMLARLAFTLGISAGLFSCAPEGKTECLKSDALDKCVVACGKGDKESCAKKGQLQDALVDRCASAFKALTPTSTVHELSDAADTCKKACGRGTGEMPSPRQLEACKNMDAAEAVRDLRKRR